MSSVGGDSTPISVLHVDDDPSFGELVGLYLEREHDAFDVTTATSAEAGMERLAADYGTVDCIVSDYDMPGADGLELLEAVRESYPDLPFVLFTGRGSEEIASEAITAGVSEYLEKRSGTEQYTVLANRIDNLVSQYRAERELETTNERTRKLYTGITDAIFALDTEGRFTHLNDRAEELLERSETELLGKRAQEEFPSGAGTKFKTEVGRAVRENEPVSFEEYSPTLDAWHHLRVVPTEDGMTIHVNDVTEKRERERTIRRQHHRLTTLLESLPIVLIGLDADEMLDESAVEEHAGTPIEADVRRALDGEAFDVVREYDERVFRVCYRPIADESVPERTICAALDITEHREARQELENSRTWFRSLTENTDFSVVTIDEGNVVRYANDAVEGMFGYTPDELVGESLDVVVPDRFERTHNEAVARYLRRGTRHLDWEWVELPARHRDGHEFPVGVSFGEYVENGTRYFTGVLRDITDRTERERELERRNEELAELSHVIARDLHRPLETAKRRLGAVDDVSEPPIADAARTLDGMDDAIEEVMTLVGRTNALDARIIPPETVAEQARDA